MNKRIRKKKMKQYAKQRGIDISPRKIDLPPICIPSEVEFLAQFVPIPMPPTPKLHVNHV